MFGIVLGDSNSGAPETEGLKEAAQGSNLFWGDPKVFPKGANELSTGLSLGYFSYRIRALHV